MLLDVKNNTQNQSRGLLDWKFFSHVSIQPKEKKSNVISYFLPPEKYLLYDIIGVIGAVGVKNKLNSKINKVEPIMVKSGNDNY